MELHRNDIFEINGDNSMLNDLCWDDNLFSCVLDFLLWLLHIHQQPLQREWVWSQKDETMKCLNIFTFVSLFPCITWGRACGHKLARTAQVKYPEHYLNGKSLRWLFWHLILVSRDRWMRKLPIVWRQTIKRGHYCGPTCMHWLMLNRILWNRYRRPSGRQSLDPHDKHLFAFDY